MPLVSGSRFHSESSQVAAFTHDCFYALSVGQPFPYPRRDHPNRGIVVSMPLVSGSRFH